MITHHVCRLARICCAGLLLAGPGSAGACSGIIYLTFDTGSMSQAALIAQTLRQYHARATFFLANEKTVNHDYTLDPAWAPYWRELVRDGHAFGSHTFDHLVWQRDLPGGRVEVKPGFGAHAGQRVALTAGDYCRQLQAVDQRFQQLTGKALDPFWRAPAGRTSRQTIQAGKACGYLHAGWSEAGFSGDELPSDRYPNAMLLANTLRDLRDGDIFMAHLGIWSRKDPWASSNLAPLLAGLQKKGFCFATLRDHPQYGASPGKAAGRND